MKRICVLALGMWLGVGLGTAQAQFWNPFKKTPPPLPPEQRVSQLIATIKSEPDEYKRMTAIQDLRDFEAKNFPEIIPLMAELAQRDPSTGVRGEAVTNLVRIRPISVTAGQAIEYVASKDENWKNRMNAQAALVRYRIAGYSPTGVRNDAPPAPPVAKNQPPQSSEPPLGDRPPIIYYDQNGKVIPAPKGFPTSGPVSATPTSNPKVSPTKNAPIAPIPSAIVPRPMPPTPAIVTPPAPPAIEPVFRNLNKSPSNPEPTPAPAIGFPTIPGIEPASPAPSQGPSLDLPPRPINQTPPLTPLPGPSLNTTGASTVMPSGRMDPSPRLTPTDAR